jgi:hypothetical protein
MTLRPCLFRESSLIVSPLIGPSSLIGNRGAATRNPRLTFHALYGNTRRACLAPNVRKILLRPLLWACASTCYGAGTNPSLTMYKMSANCCNESASFLPLKLCSCLNQVNLPLLHHAIVQISRLVIALDNRSYNYAMANTNEMYGEPLTVSLTEKMAPEKMSGAWLSSSRVIRINTFLCRVKSRATVKSCVKS